jgi:hypothetical protein
VYAKGRSPRWHIPAASPIITCSATPEFMNRCGNSSRNFAIDPAGEMSATIMHWRESVFAIS